MLVASLANGNYLLRITVLSSLRPANAADWQLKLGGLLNRRLHPLFCRRDLPVSEASAQRMVTLLDKIRNGQHVLFGPKALQPVPEDTAEYEFPESLRLLAGANEQGTDGISCYQRLCKCIMQDFLDEVTGFKLPLRAVERTRFEECVLLLVLSKRHRVDYGAHPQGVRRMAVPYRAKDVAAERAEFGHPDVAMLLSILTYYRSGLSDDYLHEVFERLRKKAVEAEAASIYEKWTAQMKDCLETLLLLEAIPSFVFDEVVGFSGTDDTRLLLPLTIEQKNLPGLACTNGIVLRNLLKQENDRYTSLPAEVSPNGQSLLQLISICQRSINVVLDAGAWVTDMSNEEFGAKWLEQRPDMEAVVFFGPQNEILVKNRAGWNMALATSPYESSLQKCLVYLDDVHTRGSDFRLSPGTCAAVTLGRRMQKDKLVQACMRMRLLGNGHTVSFYASFELSPGLLELATTGYTAESFQSLDEVLKRTSFQTPSWKLVKVQVTSDFIRTVDNVKVLDWYLRPVQWLLKGGTCGEASIGGVLFVGRAEAGRWATAD
eukprot:g26960.t1